MKKNKDSSLFNNFIESIDDWNMGTWMKPLSIFIILLSSLHSIAQHESSYKRDLEVLKNEIQRSSSYKAQIVGKKRDQFDSLYQRLSNEAPTGRLNYFRNLATLLFPIRDYHQAFYELPIKQSEKLRLHIDVDSLERELILKPSESVEGVYYYDTLFEFGVHRATSKKFVGVILKSKTAVWSPGEIVLELFHINDDKYKAIYVHPVNKNLLFEGNEKYRKQCLVNSFFYGSSTSKKYCKDPSLTYASLPQDNNRFEFRMINEEVSYLLFKSFQRNAATVTQSDRLLVQVKSGLKSKNLILDLRDNEGGSEQVAKKLYSALKVYKGRIYVLVNNGTLSQAEIMVLKLRKWENVTLIGETTKGMLAYGSNYDKTTTLPSGSFKFYSTDMQNSKSLLSFEGEGIKPEIFLKDNKNWIEQILELVARER